MEIFNNLLSSHKTKFSVFIYVLTISIFSLLSVNNISLSQYFIPFQVTILIFSLFIGFKYYFYNFVIFLLLSYEFGFFLNGMDFYSFKNTSFFDINFGILFSLPLFVFILFNPNFDPLFKKNYFSLFSRIFLLLFFSGTIMLFFTLIINDNDVLIFNNLFLLVYNRLYYFLIPYFFFILYLTLSRKQNFLKELKTLFFFILVSISISKFFGIYFNIFSITVGQEVLLVTDINFFTPFLLLFALDLKSNYLKMITFLLGISTIFLTIIYNPNGKSFLIILIVLLITLIKLFVKYRTYFIFIGGASIVFFLFILSTIQLDQLTINKFNEVLSVISFWRSDWIDSLPTSPRYRVAQFINIFIEYLNKPYYFFFGKGYFGTYRDYINGFTEGYLSAFTKQEYDNNIYYYVHDAVNIIPLTHGLFGIIATLSLFKKLLTSFSLSNYLIIGFVWFVFYYGFSFNISLFGVLSLFIGITEIDIK